MREGAGLSTSRVALTYGATSLLLGCAWHARFSHGLWFVNALAGVIGIGLALRTLGTNWRRSLGWSWPNASSGIALGVAMVGTTQILGRLLLPQMPTVALETQRLYALLSSAGSPKHFLPIIVLVAGAEELVYRGVVTTFCRTRLRPTLTVLCSALLYTVPLGASGSWLLVAIGITVGALWTVARLRSNGVVVSLFAHGMWSCATFVMFPLR